MLVRDIYGKIVIISRKETKNNLDYYNKLYELRYPYINLFSSSNFMNNSKERNNYINSKNNLEEYDD